MQGRSYVSAGRDARPTPGARPVNRPQFPSCWNLRMHLSTQIDVGDAVFLIGAHCTRSTCRKVWRHWLQVRYHTFTYHQGHFQRNCGLKLVPGIVCFWSEANFVLTTEIRRIAAIRNADNEGHLRPEVETVVMRRREGNCVGATLQARTINSSKRRRLRPACLWSSSTPSSWPKGFRSAGKTSTIWRRTAPNRTATTSWLPEIGVR